MVNIKRTAAALLAAVMVMAAVGCSSNDAKKAGDPVKTADDMLAALGAQGELLEVEDSVMDNYYTVDDSVVSGHKVYISTSFIAEEVAVFSVKEGKEADAKKMLEQRLEDLKASFDGYLPDELKSLEENAKILSGGGMVCLLAGSAESVAAAEKVFDEATK